jgi:hypothetical protein
MLQVLLLPNFAMMVTAELRKCNGIDTVDLMEQVIFSKYLLLPVCAVNASFSFFETNKEEYEHFFPTGWIDLVRRFHRHNIASV